MVKRISFELSERSINNAIKELNTYIASIKRKTLLLQQKVANRLQELAQSDFDNAIVDDVFKIKTEQGTVKIDPRMANVSVSVNTNNNVSVVIASGEDAIWVEFGTGVYFNNNLGESPHPKGIELGYTIGGYGKGHGEQKTWGFYEDGDLYLTHGTPATMPMAKAMNTLINDIYAMAKEVFND